MDRGWMIIGFFFIVVGLPVILGTVRDISKRQMRWKEKQLEVLSRDTAEKAAQYAAQIERLEERVRVLERIATDKGRDLAIEIESLRDRPLD
jgi:hypothetical protein